MIKMLSGTTLIGNKTYSPADGPFSADAAIEDRLIALGAAERVETSVATLPAPASADFNEGETSDTKKSAESKSGIEHGLEIASVVQYDDGTFHLDESCLMDCTMAELKKLAADMDIDCRKLRSKAQIVSAICLVAIIPGEESAPELEAGEPVL